MGSRTTWPLWVVGEGAGDPSPPWGRPPGGRAPAQPPGVLGIGWAVGAGTLRMDHSKKETGLFSLPFSNMSQQIPL